MILLIALQIVGIASRGESIAVVTQEGVTLDGKTVVTSIPQITGVAYSRDGVLAIFGGTPGKAGAIELVGKWKAADHKDLVYSATFGPDWLATASHDRTILVRSLEGKLLHTLVGHAGSVVAVAASPDGKTLVSGGADGTIRVWDPSTGGLIKTIANHGDRVNALAWSPDGKYVVSGSRDRSARVWQPELGRLVRILKHDAEILDVAWGDAGIVTAGCDGAVRLLESDSDKLIKSWSAGSRATAVAVGAKGVLVAVEGEVKTLAR